MKNNKKPEIINKTFEIEKFYDNTVNSEWTRIERHRLEFEMTKRALDSFISSRSIIADIGCGPGKYSLYLAKKNHRVTSVDLSEKNIETLDISLFATQHMHPLDNSVTSPPECSLMN